MALGETQDIIQIIKLFDLIHLYLYNIKLLIIKTDVLW